MKTKLLLTFTLILVAAGLLGNVPIELLSESVVLDMAIANWRTECAGKKSADCDRKRDMLVIRLESHAEFAESMVNDGRADDTSVDGVGDDGKVNGWKASYRLEKRVALFNASCLDAGGSKWVRNGKHEKELNTEKCDDAERAAIQKEIQRIIALPGFPRREGWFIGAGLTAPKLFSGQGVK